MMSLLLLIACKSSDPGVSSEMAHQTRALVESGDYEIVMISANPMVSNELSQLGNANLLPAGSHAGEINLAGNGNFIRKKGDSLTVYLPFFGTRHLGANMTHTNSAIEFNGVPDDYEYSYNESKQQSTVRFNISEGNEHYDVYINVGASKWTTVHVNSSQRSSIGYRGQLQLLRDTE
jgi:hypothetical protein